MEAVNHQTGCTSKTLAKVSRETASALSVYPKNLSTWARDYLHSGSLEEQPKRIILGVIRNERCMSKQVILELMEFFQFEKDNARSINTRVMQRHLASLDCKHPLCSSLAPVDVSLSAIANTLNRVCRYEWAR
jgi:hypothetical protein